MPCSHETFLDSVDVKRRPIRTCSTCGHRFVCLVCNDTHRMTLRDRTVACTHCPLPCKSCRIGGNGAYCTTTPCLCDCHEVERENYGYWNGMCPARKHGLDRQGQACDLCLKESTVVVYGDTDTLDLIKAINKALATRGLVLDDRSKDGADHCLFVLAEASR